MRTTQFIGLTKRAQEFLAKNCILVENSENITTGMFDEPIPLGTWQHRKTEKIYYEVVQAEPWSSGPMIFTALRKGDKDFLGFEEGNFLDNCMNNNSKLLFTWREDKNVKNEIDFENGKFWV